MSKISDLVFTNLIIHTFAVAHAVTAMLLHGSYIGDDVVLTILTTTMILIVSRRYGMPLDISAAIALLCCLSGFYLGTKGARILEESGIGFLADNSNEITTVLVTEFLGWLTYLIVHRVKKTNSV